MAQSSRDEKLMTSVRKRKKKREEKKNFTPEIIKGVMRYLDRKKADDIALDMLRNERNIHKAATGCALQVNASKGGYNRF